MFLIFLPLCLPESEAPDQSVQQLMRGHFQAMAGPAGGNMDKSAQFLAHNAISPALRRITLL